MLFYAQFSLAFGLLRWKNEYAVVLDNENF